MPSKSSINEFPSNLIDETLDKHYHVTTVESFIKTTYAGTFSYVAINNVPKLLRSGLVIASQFIQLNRNFPYEAVHYNGVGAQGKF